MVVENVKMAFAVMLLAGIMIWSLSIFWPEVGTEIEDNYNSITGADFVLNDSSVNLDGDNCIADSFACTNTSGGEVVVSSNWTLTAATCSITAASGATYNETNITCNYNYESAASGNFTEMYNTVPERGNTVLTVSMAVLVIIILIGVYAYFTKVA